MTENIQIEDVFDSVLVSMTKALTGMELVRVMPEEWTEKNTLIETIITYGKFDSCMWFEVGMDLYEQIISAMNGGIPPEEEEKLLYMNEYVNIVCGRAISVINNKMGKASRLSVPKFQKSIGEETVRKPGEEKKELVYRTEKGFLHFVVLYTLQ